MGCNLAYAQMQSVNITCNDKPIGGLKSLRYLMLSDVEESEAGVFSVSKAKSKALIFNKKDGATNFTEVTTSQANGSQSTVPTVMTQFNGICKATRDVLEKLSNPLVKVAIVAETADGSFWLLGRKYGMVASEVTSGTGATNGDFNGYNVTFTGEENELAVPVTVKA